SCGQRQKGGGRPQPPGAARKLPPVTGRSCEAPQRPSGRLERRLWALWLLRRRRIGRGCLGPLRQWIRLRPRVVLRRGRRRGLRRLAHLRRLGGDRRAKLLQLLLDDARVLRPHADEYLLARGQRLELRIGELVEHLGPHEGDGALDVRGGEQAVYGLHHPVVEVLPGVSQILIRLLEERIQTEIDGRERLRIGRPHHVHELRVALVVLLTEIGRAALGVDRRISRRGLYRPKLRCYLLARQIVDGDDYIADDLVRHHEFRDRRLPEKPYERVAHDRITLIQRRERRLLRLLLSCGRYRMLDT